jgi:hypothetical protein
MFVVDTNVLIYAAERSFSEHVQCRATLDDWRRSNTAWFLCWNVLYEFVRVVTHPRVFRHPWDPGSAWQFVEVLLQSPAVGILTETERHAEVAREVIAQIPLLRGNLVHDTHTAVLMREHGIRVIYTRDADFHRFPFLEVRDPLDEAG